MVESHNRYIADVISKKDCASNLRSWDQIFPQLNLVFYTAVHKAIGQTPFSFLLGQESKYSIDLLLPKAPGHKFANYEFTRWLNEQFRAAHVNARQRHLAAGKKDREICIRKFFLAKN